MIYYKILVRGKSCHGGKAKWHLPLKGKPGKWMPTIGGALELCQRGYHIVKAEHILGWLKADCEIYIAEPKGGVLYSDTKGVCASVRLTARLQFDDKIARSFACDCAERALPIFEKSFPKDNRPRLCIETARKFIFGLATQQELAAAQDAARAAARAATQDATWAATWAAAQAATQDATQDATWAATWAAAQAATWAAAQAAAQDAAWAAEIQWQTKRLFQYLNGAIKPEKPRIR